MLPDSSRTIEIHTPSTPTAGGTRSSTAATGKVEGRVTGAVGGGDAKFTARWERAWGSADAEACGGFKELSAGGED